MYILVYRGACKSKAVYPEHVRTFIAANLVELYGTVHNFKRGFVSLIMDIFGADYGGIEIGIYSRLARKLEADGMLDLDVQAMDNDTVKAARKQESPDKERKAIIKFVERKLEPLWNSHDIQLLVNELDMYHLSLVMKRMGKFRAGSRLHYIASQVPPTFSFKKLKGLDKHVKTMIKSIASLLEQSTEDVLRSLKNIKKVQLDGKQRFKYLNKLASIYNGKEDEKDGVNEIKKSPMFAKLIKHLKDGSTEDDAVRAVINTAAAQVTNGENLSLLSRVAALYNANGGKVATIKSEIDELMAKYKYTKDEAIEMVINTAAAQDKNGTLLTCMTELQKLYNNEGGGTGRGLEAISEDRRLDDMVRLMKKGSREKAIRIIESRATKCDATFWDKIRKLEKYIADHPDCIVRVGDIDCVTVPDEYRKGKKDKSIHSLGKWLNFMNGYTTKYDTDSTRSYGVVAYKRMGSIEQLTLDSLKVCFDPVTHKEAMRIRESNKLDQQRGEIRTSLTGSLRENIM